MEAVCERIKGPVQLSNPLPSVLPFFFFFGAW